MGNWNYQRILCALILCAASADASASHAVALWRRRASSVSASDEPKVRLIATGGTIAGGRAGSLSAAELKELNPELNNVAELSVEDYMAIGSSRMTPELQFGIAKRVNEIFRDEPELSGVVITHGSDSLEETAFLLDLLLEDDRPASRAQVFFLVKVLAFYYRLLQRKLFVI